MSNNRFDDLLKFYEWIKSKYHRNFSSSIRSSFWSFLCHLRPLYAGNYPKLSIHAFSSITLLFSVYFLAKFYCVLKSNFKTIQCPNFILFCSCFRNLLYRHKSHRLEKYCEIVCNGPIIGLKCFYQYQAFL